MRITEADIARLAKMPHTVSDMTGRRWIEAEQNGTIDEHFMSTCSALRVLLLVPLQSLHDDNDPKAFLGAMFAARQMIRDAAGNPDLPTGVASLYTDAALILADFPED